jgi:hypothetical protein
VGKLCRLAEWGAVADKFRLCAGHRLGEAAIEALIAAVKSREEQQSVGELMRLATARR